jgi:hypothetical protein
MYTANMTPEEIERETNAEMDNIRAKLAYKIKEFRRKVLKATKFPVSMIYEQRTVRKNRWVITMTADSKKNIDEKAALKCYCISESPLGKFVYKPILHKSEEIYSGRKLKFETVVFKPHFFSRYRERMGIEETGDKLIIKLMGKLNNVLTKMERRDDGSWASIQIFEDGFCLGDVIAMDKVHLTRTFVPKRMLFSDQLPDMQYYEEDAEILNAAKNHEICPDYFDDETKELFDLLNKLNDSLEDLYNQLNYA